MSCLGETVETMSSKDSGKSALGAGDVVALGVNHQGLGPIQDGEIVRIVIEPIGGFQVNVTDPLKRRWVKGIDHAAAAWVKRYVAKTPGLGAPQWAQRLDV